LNCKIVEKRLGKKKIGIITLEDFQKCYYLNVFELEWLEKQALKGRKLKRKG